MSYGGNHGCHEKINMILKKVLKKLKMSQDVENKAYEMVEEMMMDRGIEPIDSDEYGDLEDPEDDENNGSDGDPMTYDG